MFRIETNRGVRHCDGLTRREALRVGALGVGGLTLPRLLELQARASGSASHATTAQSVIILFLSGGPSHLDMWDLKPNAPEDIRGTFRPISTSVTGIQIS